ncbi:MAG: TlpA family protein disulfide reductase [Actinomycetota bacterium]|nr:TlpA family protein disulfide reductase [Actinomycetota bacterium]
MVFLVAGMAKLADRAGSRRAVVDFGAPAVLAAPLGILVPLAELAVAALLVPASTAFWGALGALSLLLLFIVGIAANLARGRRPDCHCFGQLHSAPAGWSTLARNGLLAAVAGFVVWQGGRGGPSAVAWLADLTALQLLGLAGGLVALGLLAGQWWFLLNLLRQNGRLLMRIEAVEERIDPAGPTTRAQPATGLPVGTPAPAFDLPDLHGERHTLDSLLAPGKPVLLIFTDPNCGPCAELLPEVARWQREHSEELSVSLISRGTPEENRAKHGVEGVLLQRDREVSEAYQAMGTPTAVLVNPDGRIASPLVGGSVAISELMTRTVKASGRVPGNGRAAASTRPVGKKIGEAAPEIELPDLSGKKSVGLSDFRGKETLVLFWNPGCGFCQQMLPDLKELESDPPRGAPKLLVVSAGTAEANEAMDLNSPVVLDQAFSAGRAFGAPGTPAAVLVDAEGRVASNVAAGAPAVLALAGARPAEA